MADPLCKRVTLSGSDQVEVVYSNDAGSRNLYVDYVVVDGRTVQAEGGAAVIDKGSGDAAFDGLEVIAGQQALTVNGALRFVVGTQAYAACYDANGNMTWRLLVDAAYEQLWDAENRLVQVKKGSTVQATFVYDGDGARVKATVGSVTTAYVGSHFEWTGSTSTTKRYYYAGGERVAMRVGSSTVYWFLGDHLGSTAMTVASSGTWVAELRYKAWGETRHESGTTPTSYRFTGERLESSLGLYLMGARWYDPVLGRWLSADTIVPNPVNPQSLNRYSYVLENPLVFIDPSGHAQLCNKAGTTCADDEWWPDTVAWLNYYHAPPEGYRWTKAEGFVINEFNTPLESEFSGEKIDTAKGLEGTGSYRKDFLYSFEGVAGRGSGLAENGSAVVAVLNPGGWKKDWSALNDPDAFVFGLESPDDLAKPWSIVAVNKETGLIPWKSTVYIPALATQVSNHNGFVRATGHGLLDPREIDIYSGRGQSSMKGPPDFPDDDYTIYFLVRK